jgi:osmoprotectant transport system permease protein
LDFLRNNWRELFELTQQHLSLVLISTLFAVAIGIPTGVLLSRFPRLSGAVIGFANVMQTVPSLALFGLLIPLPFVGGIGAKAAIIALALYSLLPVIRNTLTGIQGVDHTVREAAVAMGMTDRQVLFQVELPLAMSVILTGVRVAVVIAVGVATIAAAVGAGGLGTYIFRGLRQNDNTLILAGAIPAALMALFADFALGVTEKRFDFKAKRKSEKNYFSQRLPFVLTVVVIVALCAFVLWPVSNTSSNADSQNNRIIIGSKDFTESILLAEIFAQTLESKGVQVERQYELGGNLVHDALLSGKIDCYPEYTGTAFTAILKHKPITDTKAVYEQVKSEYLMNFKAIVGPPLGFSNDFAILVRGEEARARNLKTISDAVALAKNWRAGFGQDFMSREDGYPGFARVYGLQFRERPREMDLSLTYRALASKEVDLIAGNSTDGLIAALDLYQLEDDKRYFPPYQAVLLARQDTLLKNPLVQEALQRLGNSISTEEMRRLNYEVDGKKRDRKEVVREWIKSKGIKF